MKIIFFVQFIQQSSRKKNGVLLSHVPVDEIYSEAYVPVYPMTSVNITPWLYVLCTYGPYLHQTYHI